MARLAGPAAAFLWVALCVRWFDVAAAYRPGWLAAIPASLLAALLLLAVSFIAAGRRKAASPPGPPRRTLLLVVGLTVLFRLPLAWWGAAGYTTADGALSGIVAIHLRDGIDHHVFVPSVPYSGTLKSHLAAALALGLDTARAFTLASIVFYAVYVAGLLRLACLVEPRVAVFAGLYAAFAPPFVTHYSLSNDGNYVEVLAFGTWALVLAARWMGEPRAGGSRAVLIGILLGLGFWCHILAVFYAVAIGLALLRCDTRRALGSLPALAGGFVLGDLPGLMWNAVSGWESFRALVPGHQPAGVAHGGPGLAARALAMATDYAPVLLGYDAGHEGVAEALLRIFSVLALLVAIVAVVAAVRAARAQPPGPLWLLLAFVACELAITLLGLRYVPGNPRYLLFSMSALPIFLACAFRAGAWRWLMPALVVGGAAGSILQSFGPVDQDGRWREFVAALEAEKVRYCFSDFYVATRVNYLSEERVTCSAKLGPTRTEYFPEYRARVEAAPEAALIATDHAHGDKVSRRLARLGVGFERRDLLKPVLLRLSRKVDPEELFPDQDFGMR